MPLAREEDLPSYRLDKLGQFRGFSLYLANRPGFYERIIALQGSSVVGNLTMGVAPGFVSSSVVEPEFKGKGIGLALYEAALKHYGVLFSSTDLSVGSAMIWKSLVEKYDGSLIVPLIDNFIVKSKVEVKIVGWRQSGKFWWPLVSKQSKPVSLQALLKSTDPDEKASATASYYKVTK